MLEKTLFGFNMVIFSSQWVLNFWSMITPKYLTYWFFWENDYSI